MKVNELLDEAIRIVDNRLKIKSLNYKRRLDIEDSDHPITDDITIHYRTPDGEYTNFSSIVYEREGFDYNLLFARINEGVLKILAKDNLSETEV